MQKFRLKISKPVAKEDLKIIFKDGDKKLHEILAPKDDFLKSFRYFQNRSIEINQTNLIYIEEDMPFEIFSSFISTIGTNEIEIDENNVEQLYYLSCKYEYNELRERISSFLEERPDIIQIIDDFSQTSSSDQIDIEKEELISKNLDISIQNRNLQKLPLKILIRILNSPKRVIKNHHLLFDFVIEILRKKLKEKLSDDEIDNLSILSSSLDYLQMSNSEINTLFSLEKQYSRSFFKPTNSDEKIKILIENEQNKDNKIEILETKLSRIEEEYKNKITKLEQAVQENQEKIKKISFSKEKEEDIFKRLIQLEEFAINSSKEQKKFKEEIEKQKTQNSENTNITKKITSVHQNEIECPNGIFEYLINQFKKNPIDQGIVKINALSYNGFNIKLKKVIESNWKDDYWLSTNSDNSTITINFMNSFVKIYKYRLRVGTDDGSCVFNNWILKGIKKDDQEIVIDDVQHSSEITGSHPEITKSVHNDSYFKTIKLIKKGQGIDGSYWMCLRNIELFGYFIKY